MLELKHIMFERDNKKILNDINLKIDAGKFIAITGHNGSGKSTLAKIIMGIEKQDSGQVIFEGQDITNKTIDERARMGIGFAFQQPVKFKGITVLDLIRLSANKKMDRREACRILSQVGLCAKEYIDREVNDSLSGGELKRIEIALLAVRGSKLCIFDEPEAGIDLWSFQNLIQVFEDIQSRKNRSTLIISHQERILKIADEIILMKDGEIQEIGRPEDILKEVNAQVPCCKIQYDEDKEKI